MTGESAPFHLLSAASTVARFGRLGPNKLASIPPRSKWLLFLDQFKNLLIGAALLAGEIKDAVVILVVVLANAVLGFYQEYRGDARGAQENAGADGTGAVRRALTSPKASPPTAPACTWRIRTITRCAKSSKRPLWRDHPGGFGRPVFLEMGCGGPRPA